MTFKKNSLGEVSQDKHQASGMLCANAEQGRRWLEFLIEELTFVTSLEQAPEAIVTARSHLINNRHFAATAFCLEDLVFHRLGREWKDRQSLSGMLEQIQLAQLLGISAFHCRFLFFSTE